MNQSSRGDDQYRADARHAYIPCRAPRGGWARWRSSPTASSPCRARASPPPRAAGGAAPSWPRTCGRVWVCRSVCQVGPVGRSTHKEKYVGWMGWGRPCFAYVPEVEGELAQEVPEVPGGGLLVAQQRHLVLQQLWSGAQGGWARGEGWPVSCLCTTAQVEILCDEPRRRTAQPH